MIKHLACIMDGNRRWAMRKGWLPWIGHKEGGQVIKRVVDFCLKKNISYLSLYTFSLENFKRPQQELDFLFDLIIQEADAMLADCLQNGVRIRFVGDRSLFPTQVASTCIRLEGQTAHLTTLQLNFLFCYGARQEIVAGIKKVIEDVKSGVLQAVDLDEKLFADYLWTQGMPDPDLIIRTGGQHRLSNFLLYQAAYAELYFLDCFWPDLQTQDLENAYAYYEQRQRNYGA